MLWARSGGDPINSTFPRELGWEADQEKMADTGQNFLPKIVATVCMWRSTG